MMQLIYSSSAINEFSTEDLNILLQKARSANQKHDITGMLLYKNGGFIQVIEGAEKDILQLFSNIQNDPRHRNLIVLLKRELLNREFPEWSMGFREIDDKTAGAFPSFNNEKAWLDFMASPNNAKILLNTFRNLSR